MARVWKPSPRQELREELVQRICTTNLLKESARRICRAHLRDNSTNTLCKTNMQVELQSNSERQIGKTSQHGMIRICKMPPREDMAGRIGGTNPLGKSAGRICGTKLQVISTRQIYKANLWRKSKGQLDMTSPREESAGRM